MDKISEYVLATRPWSLTASIVPIIVTLAVVDYDILSINFLRAITMGVSIQAAANLTNTYFDFANGLDNAKSAAEGTGEKTLVEKKISVNGLLFLSICLYTLGTVAVSPLLLKCWPTLLTFLSGTFLAFFYTATPLGLKYVALGDITVFLCFGPLLMECTSLILTGKMEQILWVYSIPIGLLTEGILHTNNARDIKSDTQAGAFTFASLIGFDNSYKFFIFLLFGAYIGTLYISLFLNWGAILTFLTIPLAIDLEKRFREKNMITLCEETAKMHLPFGIILFLAVRFTKQGFLA